MDYYYFPTSHASRVASLVLAEKGLEPRRHFVDLTTNANFEPDYIRINERGVVPTLVEGDTATRRAIRIAAQLDDRGPPLGAALHDPNVESWAQRLDAFPMMYLSYTVWVRGQRGERSAAILDDKVRRALDYAARYPDLREAYERKHAYFVEFRAQLRDPQVRAQTERETAATLEDMTAAVDAGGWLVADRYTLADAYATAILYRLVDLAFFDGWSREPAHPLAQYLARLKARPSFDAVFVSDPLIRR